MSARRKILFISSWFPIRLRPQDGNFVQRHAEAVSRLHDVEILHVVPDSNQLQLYQVEDNSVNGLRTVIVYYRDSGNPVKNNLRKFSAYRKGYRMLNRPDLVHANVLHTNLLFALWLRRKFGIPYVVTEHFTDYRQVNHAALSLQQKLTAKMIGNAASMILPVTSELKSGLEKLGLKTPMKVVPNVVNGEIFHYDPKPPESFTFLHVSNLEPRKNPLKILQAANELLKSGIDFRLMIGGNATPENAALVKDYIEKNGMQDSTDFFGMLSSVEVAQKMNASNCFILFSEDENQPCVITEAFACGIPVISSDVGGISEFFPADAGILIKERTVQNLKEAMQKVLSGRLQVSPQKISEYARDLFSEEKIAQQYSEVYKQILNEKLP